MGEKQGCALSVMLAAVLAFGIASPVSASLPTSPETTPPISAASQLLDAVPPALPSPFAASLEMPSLSPGARICWPRTPTGPRSYFGARYYRASHGRFTAVDPVYTWRENLVDPQRWNRYAYGRNNPLRYVDPDGRETRLQVQLSPLQARFLARPAPLPPGATGWQKALHALAVMGWALNPGGIMPAPAVMAIPEAAVAGAAATAGSEAAQGGARGVGFLVTEGGDAIPVPRGATGPVPVVNPGGKTTGFAFTEGSGGPGLDPKVTGVRVMDPVPPRGASPGYPNGYVAFENAAGQGVNPATGRTVPNADPTRHVPLSPKPER
jgi:RHS repeat-associated protein